jgi:hypothetical protein
MKNTRSLPQNIGNQEINPLKKKKVKEKHRAREQEKKKEIINP